MTTQFNIGDFVRTKPGTWGFGNQVEGIIVKVGYDIPGPASWGKPYYDYAVEIEWYDPGVFGFDADELEAIA